MLRTSNDAAPEEAVHPTNPAAPSLTLPRPRGPISDGIVKALNGRTREPPDLAGVDPLTDDDLHLALYLCYELHYRGFAGVDERLEWDPGLLEVRGQLETVFERGLRVAIPCAAIDSNDVPSVLRQHAECGSSPVGRFLAREGRVDHYREFLIHRSAYHLKEADPHSWVIPRLHGSAKSALVEIQADEYGGGRPEWMHAILFADMMGMFGLDSSYGAYLERIPGVTLASVNLMSMFGLHRRLRGAAVGHLAAFELGSAVPNRLYGDGLRRLGYDEPFTRFFDEHVEADSVHDMIATYDLAGSLARIEPSLADDIIFGARALELVEGSWSTFVLDAWRAGRESLNP